MIKLGDTPIDSNDRPKYPHKILKTRVSKVQGSGQIHISIYTCDKYTYLVYLYFIKVIIKYTINIYLIIIKIENFYKKFK